jgi:hypothetical protein
VLGRGHEHNFSGEGRKKASFDRIDCNSDPHHLFGKDRIWNVANARQPPRNRGGQL